MDVGIDIGTGFTKVASGGRKVSFPSLYSCMYSDGRKTVEDEAGKSVLAEAVGSEAIRMGGGDRAILIRPVRHGMPHNGRGYEALAMKAAESVGWDAGVPLNLAVGITYDARGERKRMERMFSSRLGPATLRILPQAYGTLVYCGMKQGMVVNIGHGTTEIISIRPGRVDGRSIRKASEFVTSQLGGGRDSYVGHEALFSGNPGMVAKLARLLAEHVADEASRMDHAGDAIILAGGGSLIPGVREAMGRIMDAEITVPDDPVFSNALGLEMLAARNPGRVPGPGPRRGGGEEGGGAPPPGGRGRVGGAPDDGLQGAGGSAGGIPAGDGRPGAGEGRGGGGE